MRRLLTVMALLAQTAILAAANDNIRQLYQTLDSLIERYDQLTADKERRIQAIKTGASAVLNMTEEQKYDLNLRLYEEYVAYKFDSAYYYIGKNVDALRGSADHDHFAVSAVRMAHILGVSGLFDRARQLLDEVEPDRLSNEVKIEYYKQQAEMNLYRSEMAQYTPYFDDYMREAQQYRYKLLQLATPGSYEYAFNRATYLCETSGADKAIEELEPWMVKLHEGTRTYGIVTSTLAYFYQCKGDKDMQEHYLLLSAISDELGAVRENNSLRTLSEILMARGENDIAYRYLYQSISEARFYGSRLRMMQVGRMAPQVMQLYDAERTETQRKTYIFLGVLAITALILVVIMAFTLVTYHKKRAAGVQIARMNDTLTRRNNEIVAINAKMKEANRIKEEYIGRFLELSSNLIQRGEERSKQLNRLARERKLEELYSELKSGTLITNGVRLFHQNFDVAFLNIFPNFINEVNSLLTPDNAFPTDSEEGTDRKLTTELRVLALLRLGISDNQKIADILRSSITTIYTYRSKLKARAISKETFEDDIRKIETYK